VWELFSHAAAFKNRHGTHRSLCGVCVAGWLLLPLPLTLLLLQHVVFCVINTDRTKRRPWI
jgi:hypothetical protein